MIILKGAIMKLCIKDVFKVFKFTQNLHCNEDFLTGILATMFDISDEFTTMFLKNLINKDDFTSKLNDLICRKDHLIVTGEANDNYSFRPDIWLYDTADKQRDTLNVLFESKLDTKLSDVQRKDFKKIVKDWHPEWTYTILINLDGQPNKNFMYTISWFDIIKYVKDKYSGRDKIEILSLGSLLEMCLIPCKYTAIDSNDTTTFNEILFHYTWGVKHWLGTTNRHTTRSKKGAQYDTKFKTNNSEIVCSLDKDNFQFIVTVNGHSSNRHSLSNHSHATWGEFIRKIQQ